jgi:hypothetical protein
MPTPPCFWAHTAPTSQAGHHHEVGVEDVGTEPELQHRYFADSGLARTVKDCDIARSADCRVRSSTPLM